MNDKGENLTTEIEYMFSQMQLLSDIAILLGKKIYSDRKTSENKD